MPTTSSMKLPKPSSDEEFEKMCMDVLNVVYPCTFQRYGRKGQHQSGIDIVYSINQAPYIVAQCKNYLSNDYLKFIRQIKTDIASAQNASITIQTFIVMTSLDPDTETQNAILSMETPFVVKLMFWEDIEAVLGQNTTILRKYYPQLLHSTALPLEIQNRLISDALSLQEQVSELSCIPMAYTPGYNYSTDRVIYNKCVAVFNVMYELVQLHNQWYLHLENAHLLMPIQNIISQIPDFHDESTDGTGTSMICTIQNFLAYFSDVENKDKFVVCCNDIITRTNSI